MKLVRYSACVVTDSAEIRATFVNAEGRENSVGSVVANDVAAVVRSVNWKKQRLTASELEHMSPTLWLKKGDPQAYLAISVLSAIDHGASLEFLVMFEHTIQFDQRVWFRTRRMEGRANYDIQDVSLEEAAELARLFSRSSLQELIKRFPQSRKRVLQVRRAFCLNS